MRFVAYSILFVENGLFYTHVIIILELLLKHAHHTQVHKKLICFVRSFALNPLGALLRFIALLLRSE